MKFISNIPVFGELQQNALEQIIRCSKKAARCALMADHHKGYSQPIGGVVAYDGFVSPSGTGFDIACGNKAVKLNITKSQIQNDMPRIMDEVFSTISFGVGRKNKEDVDHPLFNSDSWDLIQEWNKGLKDLARKQLGTVGSGNHYVDIFHDENDDVWIGVHFGSRGLGHKIATHYLKAGGGKDEIDSEPTLIESNSQLGQDYIECMNLAGEYAYAGRDWVCDRVAKILGAQIQQEIHNHHNFTWKENHFGQDLWVVRKGATPALPNQLSFVGGSMGEKSVIIQGLESEDSKHSLYSTVHGAGRVMSRTEAAGKKRWKKGKGRQQKELVTIKRGLISENMMHDWLNEEGVVLRGGGTDESPHCYKRLHEVLQHQGNTIKIVHSLTPMGVAMAGKDQHDPHKD